MSGTAEHVPEARATGADARTLGRANVLAILAAALVVIIALLGYRATLGEHEVFAAEPAREMLDGGNWLLQPFADAYRTKKPPGQSWLIAASMFVTGARNGYTARLPSALAGGGLALVLGAIGARLGGRRVGLVAGLMTVTCYAVQVRARLAEADMALALCVALSYAGVLLPLLRDRSSSSSSSSSSSARSPGMAMPGLAEDRPYRPRATFWDGLLFWLALAAAFLIKGPIAFGFVLLPVAILVTIASLPDADDRLRDARRAVAGAMLNPLGVVLALLLIVGWPVGALLTYPAAWDQWKHELFDRAAGGIRRDPLVAYLGYFPLAALPWTPFALYALVVEWPRRQARLADPAALLLVLWTLAGAAFLTLIAFKRLHYALPAAGPLILLSAWGFERTLDAFASRRGLDRARLGRLAVAGWFGVVGVAWLANQAFVAPRVDAAADQAVRDFARDVNRRVPSGEAVWLVGVGEERTVWYLRRPFRQARLRDDEPLGVQVARLPESGDAWALCRLPDVEALAPLAGGVRVEATSASYREKADDPSRAALERRALVRIDRGGGGGGVAATRPASSPATPPTAPPTAPSAQP